jgi:hypothetical protein
VVPATTALACLAAGVGAWAQGVHPWFLLLWAGLAGAVTFAAGLLVSLAIDRRKDHIAQLAAYQEDAAGNPFRSSA